MKDESPRGRRLATRRPWRPGSYSSIVGLPVMAQPDPTQNQFTVCTFRGEQAEAEANAALLERYERLLKEFWDRD